MNLKHFGHFWLHMSKASSAHEAVELCGGADKEPLWKQQISKRGRQRLKNAPKTDRRQ